MAVYAHDRKRPMNSKNDFDCVSKKPFSYHLKLISVQQTVHIVAYAQELDERMSTQAYTV